MAREPLIKSLHLKNLLSFGPDSEPVELGPLNVLIGANGSGKTNFIEAIGLLPALSRDFGQAFAQGGGAQNWIWKGVDSTEVARIRVELPSSIRDQPPMTYSVAFGATEFHAQILGESIRVDDNPVLDRHGTNVLAFSGSEPEAALTILDSGSILARWSHITEAPVPPGVRLAQLAFESIRLYRDWNFGRNAPARVPQPTDTRGDFLLEDGRNLALVLSQLRRNPGIKRELLALVERFLPDAEDLDVLVQFGSAQVYIQERGLIRDGIPASRLSDGTLRWLSLLAILLHPAPPRLVCIEEPEIGLHPDMMHVLADLLRDASERMQLIVTTHSDALIEALSDAPEAVVVCEKENGSTTMNRLDPEKLAVWLKDYSLGQLWRSGQIGGNRW